MKRGRLGDWRIRGPSEVPVYLHGPFFYRQVQKNGARKCPGAEAISPSDLSGVLGPELGGRAPSFQRFLRPSECSPGIFFVPETSPGEFRRLPPALTSVLCNGSPPRLFSSFSLGHLSSFLFFMKSSSPAVRNLSPPLLCRISRIPNLLISPKQGPRNPPRTAAWGDAESSRGGVSGTKKIPGEPSLNIKNRGKWGPCDPVSAPSTEKVGT